MKSIETRFAEAMDALKKARRTKKYEEVSKTFTTTTTIEAKLNAVEAVLKDAGVVRETAPIKKNNGAGDNFVEGNPLRTVEEFRESSNNFSPGYTKEKTDSCAKGDKVMFDGLLKLGKITEAEHRKLTGQKPEGYEKLSEQQRKDFDFARLIGISEGDAFKVARMAGTTFREVSRR
jgi:hypothetical protein